MNLQKALKVLGISVINESSFEADVQARWKEKIKVCHPDVQGGSNEAAAELHAARTYLIKAWSEASLASSSKPHGEEAKGDAKRAPGFLRRFYWRLEDSFTHEAARVLLAFLGFYTQQALFGSRSVSERRRPLE